MQDVSYFKLHDEHWKLVYIDAIPQCIQIFKAGLACPMTM
jgi:hypothetical protein